jgi:hypothetical protein
LILACSLRPIDNREFHDRWKANKYVFPHGRKMEWPIDLTTDTSKLSDVLRFIQFYVPEHSSILNYLTCQKASPVLLLWNKTRNGCDEKGPKCHQITMVSFFTLLFSVPCKARMKSIRLKQNHGRSK